MPPPYRILTVRKNFIVVAERHFAFVANFELDPKSSEHKIYV